MGLPRSRTKRGKSGKTTAAESDDDGSRNKKNRRFRSSIIAVAVLICCFVATNKFFSAWIGTLPLADTKSKYHPYQFIMTDKGVNPLVNFAAGGVSGAVSKTITAPLEKVKLAIQNQDSDPLILSGEMKRYTGMVNAFIRHITELGPQSLWRGNFVNCVRYVPTAAFNLAFKDSIKKLFPKYDKDTEFVKFATTQIASGAAAGAATNTIIYPLIYVRTVLGADLGIVKKYNGIIDCLKKTVQSNGFLSLYSGIGPSTLGIVVYRGAQFGLQDIIKEFNPYQKDFTAIGLVSKFVVAEIAVAVSGIIAYPFDTMQRRLQIEASKPPGEQMYSSVVDCFAKILKMEGPGGFYKGSLTNILRGTGAALVLVIYDEIMNAVTI